MKRTFALLAGGQATRLNGVEKLNLELNGKRIIELLMDRFGRSGFFDDFVVLSGSKPPNTFLPLPLDNITFLRDLEPGAGPLGALYSLLLAHSTEAVFLLGGDMPFATPELAVYLYRYVEQGYEAVVPEGEPLAGWYTPAVLPAVRRAFEAGRRRVISFFDEVKVREVSLTELDQVGDVKKCFFNINTGEDYEEAVRISQKGD